LLAAVEVGYNTVLITRGHFTHFVQYRCTDVQVFTVFSRVLSLFKKYVRIIHDESLSGRLAHCPHPLLPLHPRDPQVYYSAIGMNRTEHYGCLFYFSFIRSKCIVGNVRIPYRNLYIQLIYIYSTGLLVYLQQSHTLYKMRLSVPKPPGITLF